MNTINLTTKKKYEVIDITHEVEKHVKNIDDGMAMIFTPHATGGIIINDYYLIG